LLPRLLHAGQLTIPLFFPFLYQPVALQPRQAIYPENAVQLVDLVLKTDGKQPVRFF
jgi:hypothetical protein